MVFCRVELRPSSLAPTVGIFMEQRDHFRMDLTCLRLCLHTFTGFITLHGQRRKAHWYMQARKLPSFISNQQNWKHISPYYYHLKAS